MTTVTFFREGSAYLGFQAGGHAGQAPRGEDIVCAAISAAVGLAECEITDVLKLPAEVVVEEETTEVSVRFEKTLRGRAAGHGGAVPLPDAACRGVPRFLKIMEV